MAIKGKTDHQAIPLEVSPEVIGHNWKGTKKEPQRSGVDLKTKFRLELPLAWLQIFKNHYDPGNLEQLRIFFPYESTDDCFETWNEAYTTKGFKHRCDGEHIIHKMEFVNSQRGGKQYRKPCRVDCSEPCLKEPGWDICKQCSGQGRLKFYVRELFPHTGMTGVVMQTVTGINDVIGLTEQLRSLEARHGGLLHSPVPSPSTFGRIPFVMSRYPKEISRPMYDSSSRSYTDGRSRGETFPILITEDPTWLAHVNRYQQRCHILEMIRTGREGLLMESDIEELKEMSRIALPSGQREALLNAIEGKGEQALLPPSEVEEMVLELEDSNTMELPPLDLAAAMARSDAMRGREAQVRLGCVRDALGLSNEDLAKIKADLDQDDDYLAAPPIERIEWYIEAMILHYGSTRYSAAIAQKCLDSVRTEFAVLADEDLALQFKQRLDSKADIPIKQKDAVATHRGVSIE